jgi:hypothetical protein
LTGAAHLVGQVGPIGRTDVAGLGGVGHVAYSAEDSMWLPPGMNRSIVLDARTGSRRSAGGGLSPPEQGLP